MTDPLIKECTAKIKAMADVRVLAVEDIDTTIRAFYDNSGRVDGDVALLEDMTIQEKKSFAGKEMEFHTQAEELQNGHAL